MKDKTVEHHIKYVETHGYDETVFITVSEHKKINHRELFPMVTPKELIKISRDAHKRTRKYLDDKRDSIRDNYFIMPSVEEQREALRNIPMR